MSKSVTLGGKRLGAGNKMNVNLHGYDRSTFNLDRMFRSSMTTGTLVPFYCNIALNGDSFDINLRHLIKTVPTIGPLMGSFKVQLDMFTIPIRLYNGLLHNNSLGIGLKMADVKFPKTKINQYAMKGYDLDEPYKQIAPNSLLAYCGVRGLGRLTPNTTTMSREFNAVPLLGYYDIFKNYYSNKQEENFYMITTNEDILMNHVESIGVNNNLVQVGGGEISLAMLSSSFTLFDNTDTDIKLNETAETATTFITALFLNENDAQGYLDNIVKGGFQIVIQAGTERIKLKSDSIARLPILTKKTINEMNYWEVKFSPQNKTYYRKIEGDLWARGNNDTVKFIGMSNISYSYSGYTELTPFPLKQIDEVREDILSRVKNQLGVTTYTNTLESQFIHQISNTSMSGQSFNRFSQNGLVVKTYLSDMFNNWLNEEHVAEVNGISQISKVSTADGGFTIDALNLAQKVYNLLNRIAVSDGTYDDWQEVVWDVETVRKAESPIYVGGYSTEITFDQVVSQSATENEPLGTLAGMGKTRGDQGGQINIKIKEPSFIMGIVSITPRIDYSQGNRFFMTDLDSLDDLHKPALDGIGFQDLLTEKLCATDTILEHKGAGQYEKATEQNAVGKQPAWIEWQTDYNENYGDFAIPDKGMFMTLNRNYETNEEGEVLDVTTYIDPRKFNYAFADLTLESNPFWVQIATDVTARRKMSAKIIPNI